MGMPFTSVASLVWSSNFNGFTKESEADVYRWTSVASIDEPVICGIEVGHVADRAPAASVIAAEPGSVNGNRGLGPCNVTDEQCDKGG